MIDFIIVGAGIAGMSFAQTAERYGKSFVVFDTDIQCATNIAGGLYNPIFVKYGKKVWQADIALAHAISHYKDWEQSLGQSLHQAIDIHKVLKDEQQVSRWSKSVERLHPYVSSEIISCSNPYILAAGGLGRIIGTGVINAAKLKQHYTTYLKENAKLIKEPFEYHLLKISANRLQYKNLSANAIIFAEGIQMQCNPFFLDLPLYGNKGEWIVIKAPKLKSEKIIQSSLFVVPLGDDLYKVGATYSSSFDHKDDCPTEAAREELIRRLRTFIKVDMEIISQRSGIRPTVGDRRALLGSHAQYQRLFVFNGLGSRGILMAPYLSECLYHHIVSQRALPANVDIHRFKK